jgi:hypothetical protein
MVALYEGFGGGVNGEAEHCGKANCPEKPRWILLKTGLACRANHPAAQVAVSAQRVDNSNLRPATSDLGQVYGEGINGEISVTEVFLDAAAHSSEIKMPTTFSLGKNYPGYLIDLVQGNHPGAEALGYLRGDQCGVASHHNVDVAICSPHEPIADKAANNVATVAALHKELSQLS